jgi:hypothetical protein
MQKKLRRTVSVIVAVGIVTIAMTSWLASRPPATDCSGRAIFDSNGGVILASKVVVRPWYGPHHVYAIFVIPDRYRDSRYSHTVTVLGVKEPASLGDSAVILNARSVQVHGDIITIEPGQHVVHFHIRTRVALWFLVTGHFGRLRATCHWALAITSNER